MVESLLQDARYALRTLRQNPGFAAVAILSLALGIGANTAIFSLIDAVLLKSMPVQAPQQLVVVARNPDKPSTSFNYPDYEYVRDHNQSFDGVIAFSGGGWPVALAVPGEGAGDAQLVANILVSGNYFEMLGVTPAIGRLFTAADNRTEHAHPYAILSYNFWQRRFAGDTGIVGRPITLNGSTFTVIGVSRAGFTGMNVGSSPDVFVPIMMLGEINRGVRQWNTRHNWWLTVIARLKPGVSMQAAIPETAVLLKQIEDNDPERRPARSFDKDRELRNRGTLLAGNAGYSGFRNSIQKPLTVLMIIVGLVLLIACANVANLLLARAASRQKEIAVRLAIGAGRGRIISQLLVESVMISLLGALLGVAVAWAGVHTLLGLLPKRVAPIQLHLSPDLRLLAFSFGIALLTGLLCGLLPALQATRPALVPALKNEINTVGRVRFDLRKLLVVAQVAISLLLLIGAGLFIRSLQNLHDLDPGFLRENVLLVQIEPQQSGYKGQRLRSFYERLLERAALLPGVRYASLANITPLGGSRWNGNISIEGYQWKPDEKPYLDFNSISSGYFATMGIPLIAGRDFRAEDNPVVSPDPNPTPGKDDRKLGPPAPVAIINETMANRFFPRQSALGRRFSTEERFEMANSYEIVGVVKDAKYFGVREAAESMIYFPNWRMGAGGRTLCLRATARPTQLIGAIRREAAALDRAIPVLQTLTMQDQFDNNIAQERMVTTLCGFFSGLALLLAAVGLYGVMAHTVTRRSREIGIRMALGAERASVLWLVLREVVIMLTIGALIGLPAAFALTRLVNSFLFGLTPQDPLSIILATVVLFLITALAGYLPARRATKVDPMIALRCD